MRRRLVLLLLTMVVAGCGGSDPAPKPAAKASAAPSTPALERQEYMGVSVLVPNDWDRYKPGDDSITGLIYGPDDEKGALGFFVTENNQSAADYVDSIVLAPAGGGKPPVVRNRRKVKVPGIGTGIRMQTEQKPQDPQERLFATSIDGLLVELTFDPGPHPEVRERLDEIMSSVRREP